MIELEGYSIDECISDGSNSLIFKAVQNSNQTNVIIKLLKKNYPSPQQLAQFKREYDILKYLDCDGVVKALSLIKYGNTFAIVMEDNNSVSLDRYKYKFNLLESLDISIQVCDILENIHRNGILHKDINPYNMIWNKENNKLRLIDFGISTRLLKEEQDSYNPNSLEGTLAYISPEQTGRMNRSVDYRSDFYSFGVSFYQWLTNKLPFDTNDPLEFIHSHIAKPPVPPCDIDKNIPQVVSDIALKLLSKMAEDRYQSIFCLKEDLSKCLELLKNKNQLDFKIAENDINSQLNISQNLYGRKLELDQLLNEFDKVRKGTTELLMISGYSGIGKSLLVNELHRPVVASKGYFISGKFDQFKRDIPYSSIIQSFKSLIEQLLMKSAEEIESWKTKLIDKLGTNGQVIIDVIPELELIIGKQAEVTELAPIETQNRFNLTFLKFVQIFANENRPLVLFLDDLQWADLASLELIHTLVVDSEYNHLLIVGTYRDNEVDENHPLIQTLDKIETRLKISIKNITLKNLLLEDITELIKDTFLSSNESSSELAKIVLAKTSGNPFFINQFLNSLYDRKFINFNFKCRTWQWDLEKIKVANFTDNVVELLMDNFMTLPKDTKDLLNLASFINSIFDLKTLSIIYGETVQKTAIDLELALKNNFITPLNNNYKYMYLDEENKIPADRILYKFNHDKIQQSAYALNDENEKQKIHYRIGQVLLMKSKFQGNSILDIEEISHSALVFDILNHFIIANKFKNKIEKIEVIELCILAGQRAKKSVAFDSGLKYLNYGISLIDDNFWNEDYTTCLSIYLLISELSYLASDYSENEKVISQGLTKAKSTIDKVKFYEIKINSLVAQAKLFESIEYAVKALQLLDITIPAKPSEKDIFDAFNKLNSKLADINIEELQNLPIMSNFNYIIAMRILIAMILPSFATIPELFPIVIFAMITISLDYGNSSSSLTAYSLYGAILCGKDIGDINSGFRFGQLALSLLDKLNEMKVDTKDLKIKVHQYVFNFINHWKMPLKDSVESLYRAKELSLEVGNNEFTGHNAVGYIFNSVFIGKPLNQLDYEAEKYIQFFLYKDKRNSDLIRMVRQLALPLTGKFKTIEKLNKEYFDQNIDNVDYDEKKLLEILETNKDYTGISMYHFHRALLFYLFGDSVEALKSMELAIKYENALGSLIYILQINFYYSLIILSLFKDFNEENKTKYQDILENNQIFLKVRADNSPQNHLHKYYLVEAETNKVIHNDILKASDLYDKSIDLANKNEFLHEEALANELTGKFYFSLNKFKIAKIYLNDAKYLYSNWDALTKVKELEKKYPQFYIENKKENSNVNTRTSSHTTKLKVSNSLDIFSAIKANQAISKEIVLSKLIASLLKIIMENAGADKTILILNKNGTFYIEGEGYLGNSDYLTLQSIPLEKHLKISQYIVNYIIKTKEAINIDHASKDVRFLADEYFTNNLVKSILCIPLLNQGKLVGIIYLENNQITKAFTKDHIDIIQLLSSQMAISIENAILYETLEEKVIERTSAFAESEERYRKLVDLSPDGIVVHDAKNIFFINKSGAKILRCDNADTLVGQPLKKFSHPETYIKLLDSIKDVLNGKQIDSIEHIFVRLDYTEFEVELSSTPYYYKNKHCVLSIFRDITDRKKMERLRENTERMMRHDLKNPLNGSMAVSKMLLTSKRLGAKEIKWAKLIHQNSQEMLKMIDSSLNIFKMEEKTYQVFPETVNVIQLFEEIYYKFKDFLDSKNLDFKIFLNGNNINFTEVVLIHLEWINLNILFSNLIKNAIEASPENETIRLFISFSNSEEQILFEIHNQGEVPKIIKNRFFERYCTYGKQYGTGLGTYSSKLIVDTYNGQISFESDEQTGTILYISLPKQILEAEQTENNDEDLNTIKDSRKLLIIDDLISNHEIIKEYLSNTNIEIVSTTNGKNALEILSSDQEFGLILLDIHLPDIDGFELYKHIIANLKSGKSQKIIPFTSDKTKNMFDKLKNIGFNKILFKPFDKKELLDILNNYYDL